MPSIQIRLDEGIDNQLKVYMAKNNITNKSIAIEQIIKKVMNNE